MFGIWRLLLALIVVSGHLRSGWWAASYAVISFYVLSGFLMTLVLNETYGFGKRGFAGFWRSRALRLLPSYWAACLLSLALIATVAPGIVQGWNPKLALPTTAHEIFSNITMIGIVDPTEGVTLFGLPVAPERFAALVPPAWALSIEIVFYFALSVWFARSARRAALLLAIGVAYTAWAWGTGRQGYMTYFFVMAGALPFGAGASLYFLLKRPGLRAFAARRSSLLAALGLYLALYVVAYMNPRAIDELTSLNVATSAAVIAVLLHLRPSRGLRRIDSFFGDLSYPVYLLHWQVGLLVFVATGYPRGTTELFALSAVAVCAVAVLDRQLLSGPISRWRHRDAVSSAQAPAGAAPVSVPGSGRAG